MPDLFIRPDQRGDIKTYTNAGVVPLGRKAVCSRNHRNAGAVVPPASRWDANVSSHVVELTPPAVRGLTSPSSGRRKNGMLSPKKFNTKSIQSVPFSFEPWHDTSTRKTLTWSANKQPKKSAMKNIYSKGEGGGVDFHSSMSALEDLDFMSGSSATRPFYSLSKNHFASCEMIAGSGFIGNGNIDIGSGSCSDGSNPAAPESRRKASSGLIRENLPNRTPTSPSRRLSSHPSDGSLSCPPPLATYADDDTTASADKSCFSYGSMDLATDGDHEHSEVQSAKAATVIEGNTSNVPEPQATWKTEGGAWQHQIRIPIGSSSQLLDTPKSRWQQDIGSCPAIRGMEPKCTREWPPTSVTTKHDIGTNGSTLISAKSSKSRLWDMDQEESDTISLRFDEPQTVEPLSTTAESMKSSGVCDEMRNSTPLVESPLVKKYKSRESEGFVHALGECQGEISLNKGGNATSESATIPKQKRRGSTGALAKRYEETVASKTASKNAVPKSPQINSEFKERSTALLVQQWEAKIREKKTCLPENQLNTSYGSLNLTDTKSAVGWPKECQFRRGSTGSLAKKFEKELIPAARPSSTHNSLLDRSNRSIHKSNPSLDVDDIGKKLSDVEIEEREQLDCQLQPWQRRHNRRGSTGTLKKTIELRSSTKPTCATIGLKSIQGTSEASDPIYSSQKCSENRHPRGPHISHVSPKTSQETGYVPNQGDTSINQEGFRTNGTTKPEEILPSLLERHLSSSSEQTSNLSLLSTLESDTCHGSVDLNDVSLASDKPAHHAAPLSASSPTKPKAEQEHALSPRAKGLMKQAHHQTKHQDSDLTPRQGRKQRRRGSVGELAKKFREEPIHAVRPSPTYASPLRSAQTDRWRGSTGPIANLGEGYSTRRVSAPPLVT